MPSAGYTLSGISTLKAITADQRTNGTSFNVLDAFGTDTDAAWFTYYPSSTVAEALPIIVAPNDNVGRWIMNGGAKGDKGDTGTPGTSGFGLPYEYSSGTSSPPADGEVRFNDPVIGSVTQIYIHKTNRNGGDNSGALAAITNGSLLQFSPENDSETYAFFTVTGQSDSTDYKTYTVTYLDDLGSGFINSANIRLAFVAKGATGSQGTPGVSGFGLALNFSTGTSSSPAAGVVNFNNSTFASITQISVSEADRFTAGIGNVLGTIISGSSILVSPESDPSIYAIFNVTNQSSSSGVRTFNVSPFAANGAISNAAAVRLSFAPKGATGAAGLTGFGVAYTFSNSTSSGPSTGQIRLNNAAINSVTQIYLNETERNSIDVSGVLSQISNGSVIQLILDSDSTTFAFFTANSQTDNGSDRTLLVTYLAKNGTFTNGDNVRLAFAPKGLQGIQGLQGVAGTVTAASSATLTEQSSAQATDSTGIKLYDKLNQLIWRLKSNGVELVAAALNASQLYTKSQSVQTVALTDGAIIAIDATAGNTFRVVLGGNRTLSNPTGLVDGQTLNVVIKQDSTGGRTLSYGSKFRISGGTPTLSTAANARDLLSCVYDGTDDVLCCGFAKGV
jgi:hypothetical protein